MQGGSCRTIKMKGMAGRAGSIRLAVCRQKLGGVVGREPTFCRCGTAFAGVCHSPRWRINNVADDSNICNVFLIILSSFIWIWLVLVDCYSDTLPIGLLLYSTFFCLLFPYSVQHYLFLSLLPVPSEHRLIVFSTQHPQAVTSISLVHTQYCDHCSFIRSQSHNWWALPSATASAQIVCCEQLSQSGAAEFGSHRNGRNPGGQE